MRDILREHRKPEAEDDPADVDDLGDGIKAPEVIGTSG
jgi:hypothetical protein